MLTVNSLLDQKGFKKQHNPDMSCAWHVKIRLTKFSSYDLICPVVWLNLYTNKYPAKNFSKKGEKHSTFKWRFIERK